jgi:hypothetical protein
MKIRKYQKAIAIFLLLNFLNSIFFPMLSYAYGITADEYDSFSPAGTTDMVDTRTGDFHYDVPLFDVPSPEGSYPIHLFYEAGLGPEKNATWTGLGWNLNVGSITRQVNDIPDDMSGDPYSFVETMNPTSTSDPNYPAACFMGYSFSCQEAGKALYQPFKSSTTSLNQYGVLHADLASANSSSASTTFDCHALNSEDETNPYIFPNTPEVLKGGSLPSYDEYTVTGEGISGQIEPLILENGTLFRSSLQSSLGSPYQAIRSYPILKNFSQSKQHFRFKDEFSNSFTASANAFTFNSDPSPILSFGTNNLAYSYTLQDASGFNSSTMRLEGGKHVDYFTNAEITNGTAKAAGFLDYPYYIVDNGGYASSTSERKIYTLSSGTADISKRIGGYSISSEEGMTYHYGLPVYTNSNTTMKKVATATGVYATRTETNVNPYAYSWLLTTITGPDYVDKNNNGYADEGDIGQWTNFNYGRATSTYQYRDPYCVPVLGVIYYKNEGGVQVSKSGLMELYFLDAVYTRSHTAIFSKSNDRNDALDGWGVNLARKLNSAILFHNDGIKNISQGMGWTYTDLYSTIKKIKSANSVYNNAEITIEDINTISGTTAAHYASQILKESKLTYDYSLCKHAANSSPVTGDGKLTLLSVRNYGRNNVPLAPSTNFNYELSNPTTGSITIVSVPTNSTKNRSGIIGVHSYPYPFAIGDIISFNISGLTYYAAITAEPASYVFNVMFLGPNIPGTSQVNVTTNATQTKNPDYSYYVDYTNYNLTPFSDQWGYFKCDVFVDDYFNRNEKTSAVSGKAVDCWSLRKITTGLGSTIEVNYESDSYTQARLTQGEILNINQAYRYTNKGTHSLQPSAAVVCQTSKLDTGGVFEYSFSEDISGKFQVGQIVQLTTLGTYTTAGSPLTYEGTDPFQLSVIDEQNGIIQGKYLGTPASRKNPMSVGISTDTSSIFYNNSSFLLTSSPAVSYGGGVRVTSITIKEGNGETYSTNYSYTNRYTNLSSGTVPFIPIIEEPLHIPPVDGNTSRTDPSIPGNHYIDACFTNIHLAPAFSWMQINYQAANAMPSLKSLANVDFINPWVLYEFVTVSHKGNSNNYLKSEEYNYQPYTWDMIQRTKANILTATDPYYRSWETVKLTINDYTSAVGQLLNYSEYDASGNIVTKTTYTYTSSPPSSQGRLDQVFHEERKFKTGGYYYTMLDNGLCIVTIKSSYPSVLNNVITTDYLKNSTSYKLFYKYDFYSGNPTETIFQNSEGDLFKRQEVPAYTKSAYAGMGSRFLSSTNKNMLRPITAVYTFKIDPITNTHIDTLSCSVNTWNNIWSKRVFNSSAIYFADSTISSDNSGTVQDDRIWRPQSSYVWESPLLNADGSYKNFVDFNWSGTPNSNWQKASTVTRYDQFSNAIEQQDINGNYASIKYGYDLSFPLGGTGNANYNEFAYSGAEDPNSSNVYGVTNCFGGEVLVASGVQDSTVVHTGKYSLKVPPQNGLGFVYRAKVNPTNGIAMNKPYRMTVWIYDNGNTSAEMFYGLQDTTGTLITTSNIGAVSLATTTSPVSAGNWKQLTLDFTLTGSYNNYILWLGVLNPSTIDAYFDDFRFHPLSETVTTNVYDKASGQVTHSLDGNNFYSRRAYDNIFRPVGDYKETIYGEIKKKEYQYNFGKRQ